MASKRAKAATANKALVKGERVFLRHPLEADRDGFIHAVKISRKLHRPWVYPPETEAAFREFIVRSRTAEVESLLVCEREENRIAGVFNLNQIFRRGFQSAYLGYWAVAPFARLGYMTEGLHLVLRYSFRILKLHRLEANIQPGNDASKALVRRCGFRLEGFSPGYLKVGGRWRDHERWAICREDWTAA